MNNQQVDVVVVGAGIMGASTAWHLANRGLRVIVCEQFALDHTRGSSHGASRIFRLAYDEVDYVHLAQRALPLWREAEAALGRELLWTTGALDLGTAEKLDPIAHALTTAEVPFERLTHRQALNRFPAFNLPDGWEVLYQPDGGVLHANACRAGLIELAQQAGADIRPHTAVTYLDLAQDSVDVETIRGHWRAGCVVLTAAGWANRLLTPFSLTVPIKVTREQVAYYRCCDSHRLLPFIWHPSTPAFELYGLPNGSWDEVKIGEHGSGPEVDPDSEGTVEPTRLELVHRFVREHLPAASDEPVASETCLYASTPDDDFVIDRVGPIVLGLGFGGHGFKFGAVVGAMLADLVQGESAPGGRFAYARFASRSV
jgi:sarcosine oxidase